MFWPIPGLISHAGVTGSEGTTCHVHATQMAGLSSPQVLAATGRTHLLHLRYQNSVIRQEQGHQTKACMFLWLGACDACCNCTKLMHMQVTAVMRQKQRISDKGVHIYVCAYASVVHVIQGGVAQNIYN